MDLTKEQREKVSMGVQALIILLALVLTVKEDAKGRSAHLKKKEMLHCLCADRKSVV